MPLFGGNKFSPKKGPQRRSPSLSNLNLDSSTREAEFGLTKLGPVKMKLGKTDIAFQNGHWIVDSTNAQRSVGEDLITVQKQNVRLQEENNLLKLKMALIIDTLTKTAAQNQLLENEIEQWRKNPPGYKK